MYGKGGADFYGYPDDTRNIPRARAAADSGGDDGRPIPAFLTPPAPAPSQATSIERELATLLRERGITPYPDRPGPVRDRNRNLIRVALGKLGSLFPATDLFGSHRVQSVNWGTGGTRDGTPWANTQRPIPPPLRRRPVDIRDDPFRLASDRDADRRAPDQYGIKQTPRNHPESSGPIMIENEKLDAFVSQVRDLVADNAAKTAEIENLKAQIALRDTQNADAIKTIDGLNAKLHNIHLLINPEPTPNV